MDSPSRLVVSTAALPADAVGALTREVDAGARKGLLRRANAHRQACAAAAEALLRDGTCPAVTVHHDQRPLTLRHEHGAVVVTPLEGDRVHLLDISSVSDDPRWELYRSGELWRREWTWLRLGDLGFRDFRASGATITPVDLGDLHGTALEERLVDGDEGWPGDDAVLDLSGSAVVELAHR